MTPAIVVDGQRQPKPPEAPPLRLLLRMPIDELIVIESASDTAWAAFDDAWRQTRDGISGAHE